jgi:hypothetical protein
MAVPNWPIRTNWSLIGEMDPTFLRQWTMTGPALLRLL